MLINHFKVAIRSLINQRGFSIINILGLSVGLTCSLLMLLWVQNQWSFNRFHSNVDDIYQVRCNVQFGGGGIQTWSGLPYPYGTALDTEFPAVKDVAVTTYQRTALFTIDQEKGKERGIFADEALFRIFDFPIIQGNPQKVLSDINNIMISEKVAKKYFGNLWQSSLGETIQVDNEDTYQVSGIFADIPTNSSLRFDYIIPFKKILSYNTTLPENYGDYNFPIYAQLQPNADTKAIADQLIAYLTNKLADSHYSPAEGIILQPFKDIYLNGKFKNGKVAGGKIEFVRLFFIAALFILFIACVNYMNLATARSSKRAKEVGIRKSIGARRGSLIAQFFTEALLMSGISVLLAVNFVHLLLPWFNDLANTQIIAQFNQPIFWLLIGVVFLLTTLLSGSYPSFLLSSFDINKVLKGELSTGLSAVKLRKGLVIFQFLISAVLIMGAVCMRQQMHYLENKDLGMDRNNVLTIPANESLVENYQVFKEKLNQNPNITTISAASEEPTNIGSGTADPVWDGFTEDKRTVFKRLVADFSFMESMKIPLIAGRYPSKERVADSIAIIINETTAKVMETDNPIGQRLTFWGADFKIVGMVKDFHLNSLHQEIAPLIVVHSDEWFNHIFVRPTQGKTKEALAALRTTHKELSPGTPFTYEFLDDAYAQMYQSEQTSGALADLFALIALFISALGLLGLATFSAEQRTKEIGIRKVLGASIINLVGLLSKDFIGLVMIALIVAIPIAWYFIEQWLQNFAYHIDIEWTVFAITIGTALLISCLTVGVQAFRAAMANPIDSIKSE